MMGGYSVSLKIPASSNAPPTLRGGLPDASAANNYLNNFPSNNLSRSGFSYLYVQTLVKFATVTQGSPHKFQSLTIRVNIVVSQIALLVPIQRIHFMCLESPALSFEETRLATID